MSSCQYSRLTLSSPTARSSHLALRAWRWSRSTACKASSARGSWAPPGTFCPPASAWSCFAASARSSSANLPQSVCCTVSQAPFILRMRSSLIAATSCLSSATNEAQPSGWPPTDLGLARQLASSCERSLSKPPRNSELKADSGICSSLCSCDPSAGRASVAQLRCLKKRRRPCRTSRAGCLREASRPPGAACSALSRWSSGVS